MTARDRQAATRLRRAMEARALARGFHPPRGKRREWRERLVGWLVLATFTLLMLGMMSGFGSRIAESGAAGEGADVNEVAGWLGLHLLLLAALLRGWLAAGIHDPSLQVMARMPLGGRVLFREVLRKSRWAFGFVCLGAVAATLPLALDVATSGWRGISLILLAPLLLVLPAAASVGRHGFDPIVRPLLVGGGILWLLKLTDAGFLASEGPAAAMLRPLGWLLPGGWAAQVSLRPGEPMPATIAAVAIAGLALLALLAFRRWKRHFILGYDRSRLWALLGPSLLGLSDRRGGESPAPAAAAESGLANAADPPFALARVEPHGPQAGPVERLAGFRLDREARTAAAALHGPRLGWSASLGHHAAGLILLAVIFRVADWLPFLEQISALGALLLPLFGLNYVASGLFGPGFAPRPTGSGSLPMAATLPISWRSSLSLARRTLAAKAVAWLALLLLAAPLLGIAGADASQIQLALALSAGLLLAALAAAPWCLALAWMRGGRLRIRPRSLPAWLAALALLLLAPFLAFLSCTLLPPDIRLASLPAATALWLWPLGGLSGAIVRQGLASADFSWDRR